MGLYGSKETYPKFMEQTPMPSSCLVCHNHLRNYDYYCPNCGVLAGKSRKPIRASVVIIILLIISNVFFIAVIGFMPAGEEGQANILQDIAGAVNQQGSELSRDEYTKQCIVPLREDFLQNSNKRKGLSIKIRGMITQIIENDSNKERTYIIYEDYIFPSEDTYMEHGWCAIYNSSENAPDLSEGDIVMLYGEYIGTKPFSNITNGEGISMPSVDLKYCDKNALE